MKASQMFQIFETCIDDYHVEDHVDTDFNNPHAVGSFENLLYQKNWIDTVQWHLEDIIRDPSINAENALKIKRRIDASNQDRTDLVEKIDDFYWSNLKDIQPKASARINTESPAWAIDRLSILSLKIYHMKLEAERENVNSELKSKNSAKFETLKIQYADLSAAIDQLLEDLHSGERIMKVYRQMKMYNDPELNPVLYTQKKA